MPRQTFPEPQGTTKFDELPQTRSATKFTVKEQPVSGPTPRPSYEVRSIVKANAPDGSVYEAYCTRDTSEISLGSQKPSTAETTRQMYGTYHGYVYTPEDVYIGKRVSGRIKTALHFPDVGSHDTAPHHLAIDNKGMVHLIVADVNIFQDNRLDLYWVIGDPNAGKWTAAWQVDRDNSQELHIPGVADLKAAHGPPALLDKRLTKMHQVSATSGNGGTFIIRTSYGETREWVVRLL